MQQKPERSRDKRTQGDLQQPSCHLFILIDVALRSLRFPSAGDGLS